VSGFSALIGGISENSIRVIPIKDSWEILDNINFDTQQKSSIIVVDMTYYERSLIVISLWFLWNLSVLYSEGKISSKIPCIVLGCNGVLDKKIYPFARICPSQPVNKLKSIIIEALTTPSNNFTKPSKFRRLNSKERYVVNSSLNGMPLKEIAANMKITDRKANYYRYSAIKKIGLQKQYEYALLMGKIFL